ncbi:DUF3710 domain-containing protein [Kitasatospora sp. NPDC094016]|uniref:DUF3710 domain-containing protein n=1 Tax=Kitasatospora sp. NPDC094016 TaxID=3154986 RepID=UPI003320C300
MGKFVSSAMRILHEFRTHDFVSAESEIEAGWEDRPTRVTPALLLLLATKILLQLRREAGEEFPVETPALAARGLGRDETGTMVAALVGDLSAVRVGRGEGLFTLRNTLVLLTVLLDAGTVRESEVTALLQAAEDTADEFLRAEDPFRLAGRGVEVGPWDVSERGWQGTDLIDLGGLRVPREPGVRIELNRAPSGDLVEAVVVKGRQTGLQLQAYHATRPDAWERARERLAAGVLAAGGEIRAWAGRAGVELRCEVPVEKGPGVRGVSVNRVLGCDGPGWLLRGIVTGEGGAAETRDEWAYEFFERIVVVPSFQPTSAAFLSPSGFVGLRPVSDNQPIPLRRPD